MSKSSKVKRLNDSHGEDNPFKGKGGFAEVLGLLVTANARKSGKKPKSGFKRTRSLLSGEPLDKNKLGGG
jgi:hypothetical protein